MSLPPFVFLEAIRHIRHFLIDKVHFVSLSNRFLMINLRETCIFPLETWGLYSTALVHNFFRPGKNGNSAGSEVTHRPMAAEINRCRLIFTGFSRSRERSHGESHGPNRLMPTVILENSHYEQHCYGFLSLLKFLCSQTLSNLVFCFLIAFSLV